MPTTSHQENHTHPNTLLVPLVQQAQKAEVLSTPPCFQTSVSRILGSDYQNEYIFVEKIHWHSE